MMSFEEAQKWGQKRAAEEKELKERMSKIRNEELRKKGVDVDNKESIKCKYEHPSMPESGTMIVLFVIGYVVCLLFKGWWVGWIALTVLLGKYVSRHDND